MAIEPVRGEEDLLERSAFQDVAFAAQYQVRLGGRKPDEVVPGWGEHFVAMIRENSRAANERAKAATVLHRLEDNRARSKNVVSPPLAEAEIVAAPDIRPATALGPPDGRYIRRTLSEVLTKFLESREADHGDRRADSDVEPVVRFLIDLFGDLVMLDYNGDHLHRLKKALPADPAWVCEKRTQSVFFAEVSSRSGRTPP